jgi:hypothetical protein
MQNTLEQPLPITTPEKSTHVLVDIKKIWRLLAPKLLNLVTVTTLLTVAGFFVIHSYLASFTRLFTFNISVTQYLAAGINLALALFWYIILPILVYGVVLALGVAVLYLIGHVLIRRSKRIQHLWDKIHSWWLPIYHRLRPLFRFLWSLYQFIAGALFVLVLISLSLVYGTYYYAQSPRMFGGGMPADVILVFREAQPTQNSVWGFPMSGSNPRQSERVQLLIELTDGVIVRDAATNTATVVKNDVLQGIIDASPGLSSITNATLTQTLPTPTP